MPNYNSISEDKLYHLENFLMEQETTRMINEEARIANEKRRLNDIAEEIEKAGNRLQITYAEPIEWDPMRSYTQNTIVFYNSYAYIARKDTQPGFSPDINDYWQMISSGDAALQKEIEDRKSADKNINDRIDGILGNAPYFELGKRTTLAADTDLNSLKTPGSYALISSRTYRNVPEDAERKECILTIMKGALDDEVVQELTDTLNCRRYIRVVSTNVIGRWNEIGGNEKIYHDEPLLGWDTRRLSSGLYMMTKATTITAEITNPHGSRYKSVTSEQLLFGRMFTHLWGFATLYNLEIDSRTQYLSNVNGLNRILVYLLSDTPRPEATYSIFYTVFGYALEG